MKLKWARPHVGLVFDHKTPYTHYPVHEWAPDTLDIYPEWIHCLIWHWKYQSHISPLTFGISSMWSPIKLVFGTPLVHLEISQSYLPRSDWWFPRGSQPLLFRRPVPYLWRHFEEWPDWSYAQPTWKHGNHLVDSWKVLLLAKLCENGNHPNKGDTIFSA